VNKLEVNFGAPLFVGALPVRTYDFTRYGFKETALYGAAPDPHGFGQKREAIALACLGETWRLAHCPLPVIRP
jgi:hypothetical protein